MAGKRRKNRQMWMEKENLMRKEETQGRGMPTEEWF
jgi:hypothetical protein